MTTLTQSVNDTAYYDDGTERVLACLTRQGISFSDADALRDELIARFSAADYLMARALLERSDPSDWHLVLPAKEAPPALSEYGWQAASSREEALAAILVKCDARRIFPIACEATKDGVRVMAGAQVLVEIRRMAFDTVPSKDLQRVQTAFKGISSHQGAYLLAKLQSLPGFSRLMPLELPRPTSRNAFTLIPSPASWAVVMRNTLKTLGCEVAQHQAQDLVCALFGVSSWHALVANRDEPRVWFVPMCVTRDESDVEQTRFYRSSAEAVAGFDAALRRFEPEACVVTEVGRGGFEHGVINMRAEWTAQADGDNTPALLCIPVDRIEYTEDPAYIDLAARFLHALDAGHNRLELDGSMAQFDELLLRANERQGISRDNTLKIGNAVFSVSTRHGAWRLQIEEFDSTGTRTFFGTTPLYKATMTYDPDAGSLNITADYESHHLANVQNVTSGDVRALLEILGRTEDFSQPQGWGQSDIRNTGVALMD